MTGAAAGPAAPSSQQPAAASSWPTDAWSTAHAGHCAQTDRGMTVAAGHWELTDEVVAVAHLRSRDRVPTTHSEGTVGSTPSGAALIRVMPRLSTVRPSHRDMAVSPLSLIFAVAFAWG
jgi:hypothetical protein